MHINQMTIILILLVLADLIRYISHIDGIERIRYTTSHPIDFSQDLINEYKNPKLANSLHLPIQSGST